MKQSKVKILASIVVNLALLIVFSSSGSSTEVRQRPSKCDLYLSSLEYREFDLRYRGWWEVILHSYFDDPVNVEIDAISGKRVALYIVKSNDAHPEIAEGILESAPRKSPPKEYATYDVRLDDGALKKVPKKEVVELRVYGAEPSVSLGIFNTTYQEWTLVELGGPLNGIGLSGFPRDINLIDSLVEKYAAFYTENDEGKTEIVEGVIRSVPIRNRDFTYRLQQSDGAPRELIMMNVRGLRIRP